MGSPSHVGELMLKPRLEILGPGYLAFRIPKPKMISVWFLWRCWDGLKPHKSRWWSPSSSNNLCGGAITKARLRWTDSNVGRPPQAFWNQQILVFMVLWCFMVLDGIPYIYIYLYMHMYPASFIGTKVWTSQSGFPGESGEHGHRLDEWIMDYSTSSCLWVGWVIR